MYKLKTYVGGAVHTTFVIMAGAFGLDAALSGVSMGLGELIDKAKQDGKRSDFTQMTVNSLMADNEGFNVMICCTECDPQLDNVKLHLEDQEYGFATYQVWVFESGTFDLKGDGGLINWCFGGSFDRDGKHVEFHKM